MKASSIHFFFKMLGVLVLMGLSIMPVLCQDDDSDIIGIPYMWSQQVDLFNKGSTRPECEEAKYQIQKYFLENSTSRSPEISVAYCLLGIQAIEDNKWQDAHWAFLAALEFDPFNVRAAQYALINSRHLGLTKMVSMLFKRASVAVNRLLQPGIRHLILGNASEILNIASLLSAFAICMILMIKHFRLLVHECSGFIPFPADSKIIAAALVLLMTTILVSPLGLLGFTLVIMLILGVFTEKQYRSALWVSWLLISSLFPLSLIYAHAMITENSRLFSVIRYATTSGYSEPAITELKSLLEDTSHKSAVSKIHYLAGSLYKRGGFYTDARQEFELYKEMVPRDSAAYINLGNIEFVNDQFQAAIENYRRAENIDPRNPIIFYNLSKANLALFRFDEARNMQNQASRLDPDLTAKLNSMYGSDLIRMVADVGVPRQWLTEELRASWMKALQSMPDFWHIPFVEISFNKAVLGWAILTVLLIVLSNLAEKYPFSRYCLKCGKPMKPDFGLGGTERICAACHRVYFRKTSADKSSVQKKSGTKQSSFLDTVMHIILSIVVPGGGKIYKGYLFSGILILFVWSVMLASFLSRCRTFDSYLKIPILETEPGYIASWVFFCGLYLLSIIQAFREKTE